jgi:hypothetical protein
MKGKNPVFKTKPQTASTPKPKHKGDWIIPTIAVLCLGPLIFLVLIVLASGLSIQGSIGGFGGTQMAAAQYTPKDVVGDLGGMPVTIPRHMAEFVEYEGDPGWGEKREGPVPERTHQSKLTSFGVQFRYPDMATLSGPEMWQDKNSKSIFNTDWMRFGITTGKRYPGLGDGWLDRRTNSTLNAVEIGHYIYVKQPKDEYGLQFYQKVNKNTGQVDEKMITIDAHLFIARNTNGQVTSYIECSTVQHHAAPCRHSFSLEFQGVSAQVKVSYRRPMLEHWQDIQNKVTDIILGFKAQTTPAASTQ